MGNASELLYCVCRRPWDAAGEGMVACDNCDEWYHFLCVGVTEEEAKRVARWICRQCRTNARKLLCVAKHYLLCEGAPYTYLPPWVPQLCNKSINGYPVGHRTSIGTQGTT